MTRGEKRKGIVSKRTQKRKWVEVLRVIASNKKMIQGSGPYIQLGFKMSDMQLLFLLLLLFYVLFFHLPPQTDFITVGDALNREKTEASKDWVCIMVARWIPANGSCVKKSKNSQK